MPKATCSFSLLARLLFLAGAGARLRHGDRLAEMGDRFLEGRAAQRLVARLAPPFDREIVEAGFGEMMRDRLGLGRALGWSRRASAARRCSAWRRLLSRLS